MATAAKEENKIQVVAPWGIEADHPRNADLLIQSIPGLRLRGALRASRTVKDQKSGEEMVPPNQAAALGSLPPIPGMQLHVDPARRKYVVIDPLYGNEELCERIRRRLRELSGIRVADKMNGVAPQEGVLDVHRMKTLCREMIWLVEADEAKVVKGIKPEMEDVNDLAGDYLLNPGSTVPNTQPRFEKDWDAWVANLNRMGA